MNRKEVWEGAIDAIEERFMRGEFEDGEFEVHHNGPVGTITIIHRPSAQAMELTDTTSSWRDSEGDIIFTKDETVFRRAHGHRMPEYKPKGEYAWDGWHDGEDLDPPEPGKFWLSITDPYCEEYAIIVHRTDEFFEDDPELVEKEKRAKAIVDLLNAVEPV